MQLAELVSDDKPQAQSGPVIGSKYIVVLDRGFVYVGTVTQSGEYLRIEDAKNIRKWGTTKGLGELVNGPLNDTVLDKVGIVLVPQRALIHLIPCNGF